MGEGVRGRSEHVHSPDCGTGLAGVQYVKFDQTVHCACSSFCVNYPWIKQFKLF